MVFQQDRGDGGDGQGLPDPYLPLLARVPSLSFLDKVDSLLYLAGSLSEEPFASLSVPPPRPDLSSFTTLRNVLGFHSSIFPSRFSGSHFKGEKTGF